MKQIKLKQFTPPDHGSFRKADKLYRVVLGNNYSNLFPSEKETLAFLAETSRVLTRKMYELNFVFADLMKIYRSAWVYMDGKKGFKELTTQCPGRIHTIENSFNMMCERSGWENGNHFVFSYLLHVIDNIKIISDLLINLFQYKGYASTVHELESYKLRCEYIKTSIVIYPSEIKLIQESRQQKSVLKVIS